MRLYIFYIAAIFALVMSAAAADNSTAKVFGGVYRYDTFEPLDNAVVDINSTPLQSMVAKSGIYSFELDPGNYSISAKYYQNGTLTYSGTEAITIKKGGSYRLDLLLLPVYSEELMEGSTLNLSSENSSSGNPVLLGASNDTNNPPNSVHVNNSNIPNSEQVQKTGIYSSTVIYLLISVILFLLLAVGYNLNKKHKETAKKESFIEEKNNLRTSSGAGDLHELALKRNDNVKIPDKVSYLEERKDHNASIVEAVSVTEAVELESGILEKQTSVENKEEYEEEYKEEYKKEYEEEYKEEYEKEFPMQHDRIKESVPEKENSQTGSADNSEFEIQDAKKNLPLPADLQEIMDIIRSHGGRITQKDLRSRLKYSEGKVSLMLADLERRDLIEKFKRGRGNIVILKDETR